MRVTGAVRTEGAAGQQGLQEEEDGNDDRIAEEEGKRRHPEAHRHDVGQGDLAAVQGRTKHDHQAIQDDGAQGGFDGVNQVTGLIVALIAALLMPSWRALWSTALGAALVHIAIGVLRPALDGGSIALPDIMTGAFWMTALALFLGYAIVISVLFLIKWLVTGASYRRHHHRHAH